MCRLCTIDGKSERHVNPRYERWDSNPSVAWNRPSSPVREHGTLKGCRQHWTRGENLCDSCASFHADRTERRKQEKKEKKEQEKKSPTLVTSVRVTATSLEALQARADEMGVSRNALVQRAIDAYLVL